MSESLNDLVERLCDGADARRQRSLRTVRDVCEGQRENGSRDFSLVTIGRLSQASGGPAERALRNRAGAPYRRVIAAYRDAHGAPPKRQRSRAEDDGLLEGIRDPNHRARIEWLRDDAKALRRQVQMLKQVAASNAVITLVPSPDGDAALPAAELGRRVELDLLPTEKEALRDALDEKRLKAAGLVIDGMGHIRTADGKELFPIGFADAVAKVARSLQAEPSEVGYPVFGDVTNAGL